MGRIPLDIALHFDRETACHLRFYVEERGMEARKTQDETWSLVGLCLEETEVFEALNMSGAIGRCNCVL